MIDAHHRRQCQPAASISLLQSQVKILPKNANTHTHNTDNEEMTMMCNNACNNTVCTDEEMECIYIGNCNYKNDQRMDGEDNRLLFDNRSNDLREEGLSNVCQRPNDPIASALLVSSSSSVMVADKNVTITKDKDDVESNISPTGSDISELTLSPVLTSRGSRTIEENNHPLFALDQNKYFDHSNYYYHDQQSHPYQNHRSYHTGYHGMYHPHHHYEYYDRMRQHHCRIHGHPLPQNFQCGSSSHLYSFPNFPSLLKHNHNSNFTTSKKNASTIDATLRSRCKSEVMVTPTASSSPQQPSLSSYKELPDLQRPRSWSDGIAMNVQSSTNLTFPTLPFPELENANVNNFTLTMRR